MLSLERAAFNLLLGPLQDIILKQKTLRLLKSVPILQMLSARELEVLAQVLKVQVFESGASILKQGEAGHTFYLIRKGEVCTSVLTTANKMKVFDASACFGYQSYPLLSSRHGDDAARCAPAFPRHTFKRIESAQSALEINPSAYFLRKDETSHHVSQQVLLLVVFFAFTFFDSGEKETDDTNDDNRCRSPRIASPARSC